MLRKYTKKEGADLLKLARKAIEEEFTRREIEIPKKYNEKRGVFVTLYKKQGKEKQLRGCIGFPSPVLPLKEAVIRAAKSAAFEDPRFFPLQQEELKDTEIEISILSPPTLTNL